MLLVKAELITDGACDSKVKSWACKPPGLLLRFRSRRYMPLDYSEVVKAASRDTAPGGRLPSVLETALIGLACIPGRP